MSQLPPCPQCASEFTYEDGDRVTAIKDLKVKGSSLVVKVGTKIKSIRLIGGNHDIDCKVDGIGPMKLKSEFV
jgi:protein PhnA